MDNTTKKVLQFLARIIRWQIALSVGVVDLKSKRMLDNLCNGDFSDFEEESDTKYQHQANHMREMEKFWRQSNPTTLTEE